MSNILKHAKATGTIGAKVAIGLYWFKEHGTDSWRVINVTEGGGEVAENIHPDDAGQLPLNGVLRMIVVPTE